MIEIGNTVRLKSNKHKMTVSYINDDSIYEAGKLVHKISYQCMYLNEVTGMYVCQYFPEGTIVKNGT